MNIRLLSFRFLLLLTAIVTSITSFASHVPGGNITYENIGPNQYVITLTLYEDCGTAFTSNTNMSISIANDCGFTSPTTLSLPNIVFQQEISQLCAASLPLSECNGGTLPGVYMHIWQDTVTLPGLCDSWTFSYSSCCRNTSTNLSGSSSNYYFEAILNSVTAPTNSAPIITNQPIPYVCAGQPVVYNMGAYEPDGNTLVYSFIPAMTSGVGGTVIYLGGFTATSPIPGISINPTTGEITFITSTIGNYVVAVLIEEYDAFGNLVGSIVQDFQFEVINCAANNNPTPPLTGISNVTGSYVQTGPNQLQLCEGDYLCFQVSFNDPDGDSIYITTNADSALPGATVTQLSYLSPAVIEVCWTALPGSATFTSVNFNAQDNSCPIFGFTSYPVEISAITSTYAGTDEIMCLGQGVQLTGSGGSIFNWSVLSGDPINIGTNFSCNNCINPIANPSITTTYIVTSNLTGGCVNVDTVTVNVVPDFTYSLTQSATSTCLNTDIQFNLSPTPGGAYSYQWTPAAFLSSSTASSPTFSPTTPGNYTFAIEITSPNGCIKLDTISATVAAAYAPNVTVTVSDSNIFCGDTIFFTTDLGGGIPASCGPSAATTCSAPSSQQAIGTTSGANTSTTWPAPFGNWYRNAKHQFLFTAAELNAMGFIGGKITEIAWEVTSIVGTTTYNSYTINMGCTNTTTLNAWETGLTNVFSPQNIVINIGINNLVLTTAYEWDGISNLVVEVCYDNLSVSYTSNSITPWTTTAFNSSYYYYSDGTPACPYLTSGTSSMNRPVTRFTTCPTIPDPANYTFNWTPPATLNSSTVQNPYGLPSITTNYQLVVTDINGGCTDTVNTLILVSCDSCFVPQVVVTNVTCNGGSDGQIFVTPSGGISPWSVSLSDSASGSLLQTNTNITTNTTFIGLAPGTYIVQSTDSTGCSRDTTVTLIEPSAVTVSVSNDTIICLGGGSANLTATGGGGNGMPYSYSWSGGLPATASNNVSPATPTCYSVVVSDVLGCTSPSDSICISLYPPILVTTSLDDSVCPGESIQISASASGGEGAPYNYVWSDGTSTVGTGAQITVTPTTNATNYCVTVTDNCETPSVSGCVTISFYNVPTVSFSGTGITGCRPVITTLTNNTNPLDVGSVLWNLGDGTSSTNPISVQNSYYIPGCYDVTLTVTSPNGCVSNTTIANYICVYDFPTAQFSATPQPTTILNPNIIFNNMSTPHNSCFWNFGGLDSSSAENPYYIFPSNTPGVYTVSLVITDVNGCVDTVYHDIIIEGELFIYVPNSFTPNGDGFNDVFIPIGDGIDLKDYQFMIFDRWGQMLFKTDNPTIGWDGTSNGNIASGEDVYVWKIIARNKYNHSQHEYYGHVSLIR